MRILVCTGIFPPDVGGPAYYAEELNDEFLRQGHRVKALAYKSEKKLPTGLRHFFYFLRVLFFIPKTDLIIALDTFSVGLPAVLAAKIFGKKIIIRIGGDFLWESYVESSGNLITLKSFYENFPGLAPKQKAIFSLTKFILKNCEACVFSTKWQADIFRAPYGLEEKKIFLVENFYGEKIADPGFSRKNFLCAGRKIRLKNTDNLKIAFDEAQKEMSGILLEISANISHEDLVRKIQGCYAVILPSLAEISPNFILDAIRADKPFILTEETGFREKLKDIGIFVNPLDQEDIKEKILFLAADKNYGEFKNKIRDFRFTHSWREIAGEFLEISKKL